MLLTMIFFKCGCLFKIRLCKYLFMVNYSYVPADMRASLSKVGLNYNLHLLWEKKKLRCLKLYLHSMLPSFPTFFHVVLLEIFLLTSSRVHCTLTLKTENVVARTQVSVTVHCRTRNIAHGMRLVRVKIVKLVEGTLCIPNMCDMMFYVLSCFQFNDQKYVKMHLVWRITRQNESFTVFKFNYLLCRLWYSEPFIKASLEAVCDICRLQTCRLADNISCYHYHHW